MKVTGRKFTLVLCLSLIKLVSGKIDLNSTWWIQQPLTFVFPVPTNLSYLCKTHVIEYQSNLQNESRWAVEMMDASGRMQSGIFSSHIRSIGSFDQCLSIRHPLQKFVGKYCLLKLDFGTHRDIEIYDWSAREILQYYGVERYFRKTSSSRYFPIFLSGKWALCLPSTCSADDINILAKSILMHTINNLNASILLNENDCTTASQRPYGIAEYFAVPIFSITLLMIITSTFISYFSEKDQRKSIYMKLACSFSLIDNWNQWLELNSSRSLKFLDGIRALSALNIILIHERFNILSLPYFNLETLMQSIYNYTYTPLWFSVAAVDVFVLLSGLLRSYNLIKSYDQGKFEIIKPIIRRYFRITPTYLFVILFFAAFYDRIDNGPEWYNVITLVGESCRKYWWQNILYINNYCSNECINTTWYLGLDMQLFILAPLLIYPLWKWHVLGKSIMFFGIIMSLCIPMAVLYSLHFPGEQMFYSGSSSMQELFITQFYIKTHNRVSPYLVGIAMGFVIRKSQTIVIRKWVQKVGWVTCILVLLAYSYYPIIIADVAYTPWEKFQTLMYYSVGRFVYSLTIAWMIYACNMSNNGIIERFLSCNILAYLAKISYCMYIIHYLIIIHRVGVTQTPVQAHPFIVIQSLVGDFGIIIFFSLILHVAVESSFANVTEMLFVTKHKHSISEIVIKAK